MGIYDIPKFNEAFDVIHKEWKSFKGLILVLSFLIVLLIMGAYFLDLEDIKKKITLLEVIIIFSITALIAIIWKFSRKLPKNKIGTVGIVLAVSANSKEEINVLSETFKSELKELIQNSVGNCNFSLIDLPEIYAKKVWNIKYAQKYLNKTRSLFMIMCLGSKGNLKGKEHHVLKLRAIVRHAVLPEEAQIKFQEEISRAFPQKVLISKDNDVVEFEITSKMVDIAARFILGLAALVSNDYEYAEMMFEDLEKRISHISINSSGFAHIKNRLPEYLKNIYSEKMQICHLQWTKDKTINTMDGLKLYMDKLDKISPGTYYVANMRAIYYFVSSRNTKLARNELLKCKNEKDSTWRFSEAFIIAYDGNLKQSISKYQIAFRKKYSSHIPNEIEKFILWVLKEEPEKNKLYFCLGLINMIGKNNKELAVKYYKLFLSGTNEYEYVEQHKLANDYISKLLKIDIPEVINS